MAIRFTISNPKGNSDENADTILHVRAFPRRADGRFERSEADHHLLDVGQCVELEAHYGVLFEIVEHAVASRTSDPPTVDREDDVA